MTARIWGLTLACVGAFAATGAMAQSSGQPGEPEYVWNAMRSEKLQALRAKGDATRGEITFEICQGCHRPQALGRPDGTYPRLAGQHDTVLIKQMTDVRAGRRKNDKMLPFIDRHVVGAQDIADVATYLSQLPVPPNNGKGSGEGLAAGGKAYQEKCQTCHGAAAEGDAAQFYPRLSGQHYKYLVRETIDIRDGVRLNANPKMVEAVKGMSNTDIEHISDYVARLPIGAAR